MRFSGISCDLPLFALSVLSCALLGEGYLYTSAGESKWSEVKDIGIRQISAGYDDAVWGLTNAQEVFVYTEDGWNKVPGNIQAVSAINKYSAWGIGQDNAVFRFTNGKWYQVNGQLSSISVSQQKDLYGNRFEHVWGISPTNRLWYCKYQLSDRYQCQWSSVRAPKDSHVVALAAADESVYALVDARNGLGYQMYWYHKGRWAVLDQRLTQISSSVRAGKIIGHDAKGNIHILSHGEKAWRQYGNLGITTGYVTLGSHIWFLSREKADLPKEEPEKVEYW
ncbi:hypothetical protein K493DRAFT_375804 [Basidiobolus meristosporus CBS 931.73]|uniref:Fucose-specific lectin n=1 Tax=Basidiobolus meristosporus CBS 931.73 TaxID=1314790 RepID=A0A1Y1Y5R0_9FUNG|nr:hypothetical protein K493DRAFT_375804 [Basidiobolus meristosporus CBS 931.73]|eukprot:ORX93046.1 hypothetical protein K493DRAFT_375804 [Basidiobolus meristosporus CBS 931.73]